MRTPNNSIDQPKHSKKLLAIAMLVILAILVVSIPLMQQFSNPQGKFTTDLTPGVVVSNGTEHSLYVKNVQSGTYNYYVKCADESGNATNDMPVTFNVNLPQNGLQASTKTSYTSSGGGGSIATSTALHSKTFDQIPESIGADKITVLSEKDLTNTVLSIDNIQKPSDLEMPSINVYRYLAIKLSDMTEKDVSKASISFKVEKTWVDSNYIDKTKIYLNRYNNGWGRLSTVLLKEDSKYYYYQADSPGFSVFAITGDVDASKLQNSDTPVVVPINEKTQSSTQQEQSYQIPRTESPSIPFSIELIVGVIVAIIIALVIVIFLRKKHQSQPMAASSQGF